MSVTTLVSMPGIGLPLDESAVETGVLRRSFSESAAILRRLHRDVIGDAGGGIGPEIGLTCCEELKLTLMLLAMNWR